MLTDNTVISLDDVKKEILEFCLEPHGPADILGHIKVETTKYNYSKFINQLIDKRFLTSAFLRKRNAANQQYVITKKGLNYLKAIA
jgi:predicted transcriptional regulator